METRTFCRSPAIYDEGQPEARMRDRDLSPTTADEGYVQRKQGFVDVVSRRDAPFIHAKLEYQSKNIIWNVYLAFLAR